MATLRGGPCPCGLPAPYEECCGALHSGRPAPTAVLLDFRADYRIGATAGAMRENSQFGRHSGQWVYLGPVAE